MNPDLEIERLRWTLQNRGGMSYSEVDDVCEQASNDVNTAIMDIVANAASEAVSYAESIEAYDFVPDIDIRQEGWMFAVRTKSGITDYSVDAVQNLYNLLKNADIAADGSKYKVIPLKPKADKKVIGTSSGDMMRAQTAAATQARQAILDKKGDRSAKASMMAESFKQQVANQIQAAKEEKLASMGPTVDFRTATSKQDPATQWVIPKKDRDMTQYLVDLNDKIKSMMEDSVSSIISGYQRGYT